MLFQILIFILPFTVSIPYFTYPFTDSFSASYRKIYFFSDDYTPTLLTSYNYSLNLPSPSGSAFSENKYFSHLEILTQTKTILRLPKNNYVIAGLRNNQLLIFTSTGKTIYSINFYSITEQNEEGKWIWKCPNCGNTNQDKMSVVRRTCGYLGANYWNQGRTQEIKDRVLHL